MDIHKSVPPRDWHVTTVTSVSRQARDGACGELSCQPRQEFHSKSHNASHALLLASLADGGFRTGQAHADVTSGTGALCGWQARGKDRKRNIEQKAARTEKQQQRNGRISKGAGLSSGDNGDINGESINDESNDDNDSDIPRKEEINVSLTPPYPPSPSVQLPYLVCGHPCLTFRQLRVPSLRGLPPAHAALPLPPHREPRWPRMRRPFTLG